MSSSPSPSSPPIDFGVDVLIVPTTPFPNQKPGTSGLRKKVTEFQQPHYLENFVECILLSLPQNSVVGSSIVLSGDGRYYNNVAIRTIIRQFAAWGVSRVIIGQQGIMSTPCVSSIIRSRKSIGGIILTASHNPGGPHEDFGIKWNGQNGGPANESVTDSIYAKSTKITSYKIAKQEWSGSIQHAGEWKFGQMIIEVVSATQLYGDHMATIFDFPTLRTFLSTHKEKYDFSILYDGMSGAGGPFALDILCKRLGAPTSSCINCQPKEDFGGGHPDPNLTYAHQLVERMGLTREGKRREEAEGKGENHKIPDFGAASDGDADRNMILGKQFFVTPSDSVAIITANFMAIPYFTSQNDGKLRGVARSMPTSCALDRVSSALHIPCYEVPTGWKYFGNLMDDGKLSICGEESFGTGSDHIREKDGLWAVLAWLSILAYRNGKGRKAEDGEGMVSVENIVKDHWKTYGRNYYSRYDYEGVESKAADQVMNTLLSHVNDITANKTNNGPPIVWGSYTLSHSDEFTYTDPVDHSISSHQGIRFQFTDGSRIVYRLSGTGSVGATIRVYIEKYEKDEKGMGKETGEALRELIDIAIKMSNMKELTGREEPTVIT